MFSIIKDLSAMAAGVVALYTFWRSGQLKRAEWLSNLHSKFYESPNYKMIRHLIDYEPQPEFDQLKDALTAGGHDELAESFVDYLNFFEFVASLRELGQLSTREICMVFEYYVLLLDKHPFIVTFIKANGFENLAKLITVLKQGATHRIVA